MSALSGSRQMTKSTILFFISLIPHLDETLSKQLTNPGLLGFFAKFVKAEKQWLDDFKKHIDDSIFILASRDDSDHLFTQPLWEAKRIDSENRVSLSIVHKLSASREESNGQNTAVVLR